MLDGDKSQEKKIKERRDRWVRERERWCTSNIRVMREDLSEEVASE